MTKKQDEAEKAALAEEQALAEEKALAEEPTPGDSVKRTKQGNTDPRDLEVFDGKGVFIEKRDR